MTQMTPSDPADVAQMEHLRNQVHDHSSVLQALQVDMRHAVKLLEKLGTIADKQADIQHGLDRHTDAFKRVFEDMARLDGKQAEAINALTLELKTHRDQTVNVAGTVTSYEGGIKTLKVVGGTVTALLIVIGAMYSASVSREFTVSDAAAADLKADFERRKLAIDLRMDALTQQVQEVRIGALRYQDSVDTQRPAK